MNCATDFAQTKKTGRSLLYGRSYFPRQLLELGHRLNVPRQICYSVRKAEKRSPMWPTMRSSA